MAGRRVVWLIGCVGLSVLGGCEDGAEVPPFATTIDSAGTRIVSYDLSGVDVQSWRDVGEPDLHIGVVDGAAAYSFSVVGDVVVADDGSIVVTDRRSRQIRVFDNSGTHLRSFGRAGDGPGEFASSPWIAGVAGDSVFAFDSRSARVTAFSLEGELLEEVSVRSETVGRPLLALRQEDGTYLTRSRWINPETANEIHDLQLVVDSMVVERLGADGGFLDTVFVAAETPRARSIQGSPDTGFRVRQVVPPFLPSAHLISVSSTPVFAYSEDFDVALGIGDEPVPQRLRVSGVRHPATGAELRAIQEAILVADLGEDGITPQTRQVLEYIPEQPPAFRDLRVSAAGNLWISLYDPDRANETTWLVFTLDGDLRGSVRTPPGFSLRSIEASHVIGVVTDDFDVPFIVRHPLLPPGPPVG
ncbi:MAG: 6-bladed beta-propeller [Gemmatimonadota bacterium]